MENLEYLKGKFITFEGGEGAGKSTQSKLFVEYLNNNGIEAVWSREPGGCEDAEEIRKLLISGKKDRWDGITELLLMYAARRVHTEKKIKPLLKKNISIVSDRYLDSSLAYQGFGHKMPLNKLDYIRQVVLDNFKPDLTIIMDIDPIYGLKRTDIRGEKNRFEDLNLDFHKRVRDGFNYVFKKEEERCIKFSVKDQTIEDTSKEIIEKVKTFFNKKK